MMGRATCRGVGTERAGDVGADERELLRAVPEGWRVAIGRLEVVWVESAAVATTIAFAASAPAPGVARRRIVASRRRRVDVEPSSRFATEGRPFVDLPLAAAPFEEGHELHHPGVVGLAPGRGIEHSKAGPAGRLDRVPKLCGCVQAALRGMECPHQVGNLATGECSVPGAHEGFGRLRGTTPRVSRLAAGCIVELAAAGAEVGAGHLDAKSSPRVSSRPHSRAFGAPDGCRVLWKGSSRASEVLGDAVAGNRGDADSEEVVSDDAGGRRHDGVLDGGHARERLLDRIA